MTVDIYIYIERERVKHFKAFWKVFSKNESYMRYFRPKKLKQWTKNYIRWVENPPLHCSRLTAKYLFPVHIDSFLYSLHLGPVYYLKGWKTEESGNTFKLDVFLRNSSQNYAELTNQTCPKYVRKTQNLCTTKSMLPQYLV